jgi:hypothetical protein
MTGDKEMKKANRVSGNNAASIVEMAIQLEIERIQALNSNQVDAVSGAAVSLPKPEVANLPDILGGGTAGMFERPSMDF